MTVYVGFLRGINVGGKNKIKMTDLKKTLEAIGLAHVQTYLQSGNVFFQSEEPSESLRPRIEKAISDAVGVAPTVILRTAAELAELVGNCPYDADDLSEGESIQISVLTEEAPPTLTDILSKGQSEVDEFQMQGCTIYFLFRQSVLDSKLASNMQKLGDRTTTRNWNTMSKLVELAEALQQGHTSNG
ncbi:DUF1697 domain-containing protein [Paenibacillus qinlingensis]|uniref:Uncharacterized protein (DUF1697 family) n=1 Tax=Paenibacillus qinlingensis TaxID=1837343 RepID=A0ABU1P3P3_9BACL|nr:DUF1697 domain-containing protein [Paenibacillus qinlingensis]MDR6553687.1 uncharacterized protein (DUF1697 family) [Paenibacillus qinlingensis]